MKLAIIPGHNSKAQGAVRKDTGETEYRFNSRIARHMEDMAESVGNGVLEVATFYRTPGSSYTREIERVYDEVDEWGADASIELHFNSFSGNATGTEVLSSSSARSLVLANAVQDELVKTLGLADRGVKTKRSKERGGASLYAGRAPAILVEPFFGSNDRDLAKVDEWTEERNLAAAYLTGCIKAMRTFPRQNLNESRTIKTAERDKKVKVASAGSMVGSAISGTLAELNAQVQATQDGIQEISGTLSVSGPIGEMLPYISGALGLLSVGLLVYGLTLSNRIEKYRTEDFENGIR